MACVSGAGLRWGDWARHRPAARVRLAFDHVADPAGGVVMAWVTSWAGTKNGSHAERSPRMPAPPARSRSGRPRRRTTAHHRRPPRTRSRWPEAGTRHRPGPGGPPSSASTSTLPGARFRSVLAGSDPCHPQTRGCVSPGAYCVHSALVGGPTSAHSAAYGSAKSGICHVRTVPSVSALARSLPSGLNATPFTPTTARRKIAASSHARTR